MSQPKGATDKVRAIATFVCAMLIWPMAMVAAQGVTLGEVPIAKAGDKVVICTSTGLQTVTLGEEHSNTVTGKVCLICMSGGCDTHHANVPDVVAPTTAYISPFSPFIFTDLSARQRAFQLLILSRAPPVIS